jgi:hypothetical protein
MASEVAQPLESASVYPPVLTLTSLPIMTASSPRTPAKPAGFVRRSDFSTTSHLFGVSSQQGLQVITEMRILENCDQDEDV